MNSFMYVCLGIAIVVAITNTIKGFLAERDIRNGMDTKDALAYHKKWLHKKEEKEAYTNKWTELS